MNKKTVTALALMSPEQRAVQVMGVEQTKVKLEQLAKESTTITSAEGKDNYDATHAARMKLKNTRVAIQKTGKDAREDATAFSKAVIAVEKDLIAVIEPEEKRLQALQDAQDAIIEAERAAIAAREAERVAAVERAIKGMRDCPLDVQFAHSSVIKAKIDWLSEQDDESFEGEYLEQAQSAKRQAMAQLQHMHGLKLAAEANEEQLRKDRADMAERQAVLDRQAAEQAAAQKVIDDERAELARQQQAAADELAARERDLAESVERKRIADENEAKRKAAAEEEQRARDRDAVNEAHDQLVIDTVTLPHAIEMALKWIAVAGGETSLEYRSLAAAAARSFPEEK